MWRRSLRGDRGEQRQSRRRPSGGIMNRTYSAIAVSALALGAAALTATEASAQLDPDSGSGYATPDCWYANHPVCEVVPAVVPVEGALGESLSDDNGAEALQAGVSALGGAGLAFGGLWLYRRRQVRA
jgi:hypothetical protein